MRSIPAIVTDSRRLDLSTPISLPSGTRIRVLVGDVDDYGTRLKAYYASASATMIEEERSLTESLTAADAVLPSEEPWW
jgi:hypothetical protein